MEIVTAEILTIGDEILYGQITDTNTQWIGAELSKIGVKVVRKTSVGDDISNILVALKEAKNRANVVLITGGLGPTKDDITKSTLCTFFNTELVWSEEAWADLQILLNKRNRPINELTRLQAMQPKNSIYIKNSIGTAPGIWFEQDEKVFVAMPGVPYEMTEMMKLEVLERIKQKFNPPAILHKNIRTIGIPESTLAKKIEHWEMALPAHLKLAYLPSKGQVKLRISGIGSDKNQIAKDLENQTKSLLEIIHEDVYGFDDDELEMVIGKMFIENGKTLALAESCTGGFIASALTKISGASQYFSGSITAYQNEVKTKALQVNPETIAAFSVVSEAVAKEMAQGALKFFDSDFALSTTGYAEAPISGEAGLVWIGIASAENTEAFQIRLPFTREINIQFASTFALNYLRLALKKNLKKGKALN